MTDIRYLNSDELEQGLDYILQSPKDEGTVELIVRRPGVDQREVLAAGRLDTEQGLVGDNWLARGSRHMPDSKADPDMQINIIVWNRACVGYCFIQRSVNVKLQIGFIVCYHDVVPIAVHYIVVGFFKFTRYRFKTKIARCYFRKNCVTGIPAFVFA